MPAAATTRPHLGTCPLCEQGLIRVVRCPQCHCISALCDECEALWAKPRAFRKTPPDSQHPRCPDCQTDVEQWQFLTPGELKGQNLDGLVQGTSM